MFNAYGSTMQASGIPFRPVHDSPRSVQSLTLPSLSASCHISLYEVYDVAAFTTTPCGGGGGGGKQLERVCGGQR